MSESKRDVFMRVLGLMYDAESEAAAEYGEDNFTINDEPFQTLIRDYDAAGKVAVPQTVASWIDECKHKQYSLASAFDLLNYPRDSNDDFIRDELVTFGISANAFARAWLDGYTVEAEQC